MGEGLQSPDGDCAKIDVFSYMKQLSKEQDAHTLAGLEVVKPYRDVYSYTSHLPGLRNYSGEGDGIPKARNALASLVFDSLSGEDRSKLFPILSFLELSTASSYVLDDVIDDQVERNKDAATWVKFGRNKAIIGGSLQAFAALRELEKAGLDATRQNRLHSLGVNMWLRLWIGEGFNEEMKQGTTKDEYVERCYDVCGVMFETAARMAALGANASDEAVETYGRIGRNYGLAVMFRNDLIDLLPKFQGRSKALTKKPYEDVTKGIYTYPLLHVIERCTSEEKNTVEDVMCGKADVSPLHGLLEKYGATQAMLDLITEYKGKTLADVEKLPDSNPKKLLVSLANGLENLRSVV